MIPAIEIAHLTALYHDTIVLRNLCAAVPAGSMVGIVGPNGAGKSTLLKILAGIMRPFAGSVKFFGGSPTQDIIAYVPQRLSVDWDFPITVYDVVLMGRYRQIGWFAKPKTVDLDAVLEALEKVGMLAYRDRPIANLSGGQQQRVFLARALVQQPNIYLLDEPLNGIDVPTERIIIKLLATERDRGKTIMCVHHNLQNAGDYFDHLMFINKRLVAFGPSERVNVAAHAIDTFNVHEAY